MHGPVASQLERGGLFASGLPAMQRGGIWVHAVSVGESI
ncbi:hypothetical protein Pgy4_40140, partial [Pseudomonas savastanoi pv. glycinea str. race 4]